MFIHSFECRWLALFHPTGLAENGIDLFLSNWTVWVCQSSLNFKRGKVCQSSAIPLFWVDFSLVNDPPGHCNEAVRVPKSIQWACGLCKSAKMKSLWIACESKHKKDIAVRHVLERTFTGRFSDVKQNGFQPGKWQCKQNGSQTAFFGTGPTFDGYLKTLFIHLLARRHAWCSSSNVLLLHGLSCRFLGFQSRQKTS